MLEKLGYDILLDHVFPNLSGKDIVAVSMCSKRLNATVTQLVWRSQYRATFDRTSAYGHLSADWEKNYSCRMNSSIYFWGKNIFDRSTFPLGLPHNNHSGICVPWRFPGQLKARQITFSGYGLLMLDFEGNIWLVGSMGPSPAYFYGKAPHCITSRENPAYDFISAGRNFLVALAGTQIHTFAPRSSRATAVEIEDEILCVSAGWEATAAISDSRGILIWRDILNSPDQVSLVEGTPGAAGGSLATGAGFVLYLDESRRLHFIEITDAFLFTSRRILAEESPVRIRATYNRFAVICQTRMYLGKFHERQILLEEVPNPEKIEFCDVALGDHHNLGLALDGSVYSWGCESRKCGSLGLGTENRVIEGGGTLIPVRFGGDLQVQTPTKLALEGVLSICAGGWQSAAIATNN